VIVLLLIAPVPPMIAMGTPPAMCRYSRLMVLSLIVITVPVKQQPLR